jgi:hypothetical protein
MKASKALGLTVPLTGQVAAELIEYWSPMVAVEEQAAFAKRQGCMKMMNSLSVATFVGLPPRFDLTSSYTDMNISAGIIFHTE